MSEIPAKPLEWGEDDKDWWAATAHGFPFVYDVRLTDRGQVRLRFGPTGWDYFDGTLDEAKAHAQADYERRVLMAIDHPGESPKKKRDSAEREIAS